MIFTKFQAKLRQVNNTIIGCKYSNIYSSKNTAILGNIKTQMEMEMQMEGLYHLPFESSCHSFLMTICHVLFMYYFQTWNESHFNEYFSTCHLNLEHLSAFNTCQFTHLLKETWHFMSDNSCQLTHHIKGVPSATASLSTCSFYKTVLANQRICNAAEVMLLHCIVCMEYMRPRWEALLCDGCQTWQHRKCNTDKILQ